MSEPQRPSSLLRADCCWHSAGPVPDDVTCCVCDRNPCGHRSPEDLLTHEDRAQLRLRRAFDAALAFALEHGHREPNPFEDESCPSTCKKALTPTDASGSQGVGDERG